MCKVYQQIFIIILLVFSFRRQHKIEAARRKEKVGVKEKKKQKEKKDFFQSLALHELRSEKKKSTSNIRCRKAIENEEMHTDKKL